MKLTIVPYSVKGNQDGTISLKLAKGADRSELIKMEGVEGEYTKYIEHAEVQTIDDVILGDLEDDIYNVLIKIQGRRLKATGPIEAEGEGGEG